MSVREAVRGSECVSSSTDPLGLVAPESAWKEDKGFSSGKQLVEGRLPEEVQSATWRSGERLQTNQPEGVEEAISLVMPRWDGRVQVSTRARDAVENLPQQCQSGQLTTVRDSRGLSTPGESGAETTRMEEVESEIRAQETGGCRCLRDSRVFPSARRVRWMRRASLPQPLRHT